ncbi:MAG TPA: hypothetical protein VIL35_13075 [Vicinamibacterales bacterium]
MTARIRRVMTFALLGLTGAAPAASGERCGGQAVLERAARLAALPGGVPVRLIDPEFAPDPEPLRRLDAFVVREPDGALRPVIYVNCRSALIARAQHSAVDVSILAAVLHHEAQHLRGASEPEARRAELEFLRTLLQREGQLDAGRAYLQTLVAQLDRR